MIRVFLSEIHFSVDKGVKGGKKIIKYKLQFWLEVATYASEHPLNDSRSSLVI